MKDQLERDFQELSHLRQEYEAMGQALDAKKILSDESILRVVKDDLKSVTSWYRDQWTSSLVALLIFAIFFFNGKDLFAHHVMLVLMAILLIEVIIYFIFDRTLAGIGLTHLDLATSSRKIGFIQRFNRISDIMSFFLYLLMAIAIAIEFGLNWWGIAIISVVFIIFGIIKMKETSLRNKRLKSVFGRMKTERD